MKKEAATLSILILFYIFTPIVNGQDSGEPEMHVNGQGIVVYPINEKSDIIEYPFGYTEPIVKASPLRISRIELEEGEEVVGQAVGDATRWQIDYSLQGEGESSKVIFFVKPIIDDVSTNFVITTDRRTYDITLTAQKINDKGTNPDTYYTRGISFYYPNDASSKLTSRLLRDQKKTRSPKRQKKFSPTYTKPDSVDDFERYEYEKGKHGFPWEPQAIWDNNRNVFIQLPDDFDVDAQELPSLFLTNKFGDKQQMNFSYDPATKVLKTDRVFKKAILTYQFKKRGFLGIGKVTRDKELLLTFNN